MTQRESSSTPAAAATARARSSRILRLAGFTETAANHIRNALRTLTGGRWIVPPAGHPSDAQRPIALEAADYTAVKDRLEAALTLLTDATQDPETPADARGASFAITRDGLLALELDAIGKTNFQPLAELVGEELERIAGDDRRPYGAASSTRRFAASNPTHTDLLGRPIVDFVQYANFEFAKIGAEDVCFKCGQPAATHPYEFLRADDAGIERRYVCIIPPAERST